MISPLNFTLGVDDVPKKKPAKNRNFSTGQAFASLQKVHVFKAAWPDLSSNPEECQLFSEGNFPDES
jgi:hypothetical protein